MQPDGDVRYLDGHGESSARAKVSSKTLELGYDRLRALAVEGRIEGMSVTKLADVIKLSPTTVQRLIVDLIEIGRIRRIKSPNPAIADTLELIGPESSDMDAKEAQEVLTAMREALSRADELIQRLVERDRALTKEVLEWRAIKENKISDMTDDRSGNRIIIIRSM